MPPKWSRCECRSQAFAGHTGHDRLVLGIVDRDGFVDQHHRNAFANEVLAMQSRVVQAVRIAEVVQRSLVLGAGKYGEQSGVESHQMNPVIFGWVQTLVTSASTSATRCSQSSRVAASRFSRSSGSVLAGRR